ncbi:MAG TPA: hypothetical protein P5526_11705 [Anaerolineae bacterium]|nr:hypothetical protein [Anaerolineae bacterium]MCB0178749.1 hypothetical protein [Anaerolineae bacterium]MCB0225640.1 hypothetical protein [Anaerolineae bacterium]MCB9103014.1 hypothetical protein [Anaerolineales bacterium]HRV92820.1 hypothetical protein [Anaerolineae bacterium]
MKVKTNIKSGYEVKDFFDESKQAIKQAGRNASHVAQEVTNTVTSPKFWTWPW